MSSDPSADTGEFIKPVFVDSPPPFSSLVQVDVAALTHAGRVRPQNEDHFLIGRGGRFLDVLATNLPEGELPVRSDETAYVLIVADGMGGEEGGEVASRLAIRTLMNLMLHVPDWILRLDTRGLEEVHSRMVQRYRRVDALIHQQAEGVANLSRMGTTMTAALSLGSDLLVAHVGDSRVYLLRQGRLRQLTHDQTLAQALADEGHVPQEQAARHRLSHVLTQALGKHSGQVKVEAKWVDLADKDCLLLCTDGLTNMVPDPELAEVLGRGEPSDQTCRTLIDLALERGAPDNVTAIVARYRFPREG